MQQKQEGRRGQTTKHRRANGQKKIQLFVGATRVFFFFHDSAKKNANLTLSRFPITRLASPGLFLL